MAEAGIDVKPGNGPRVMSGSIHRFRRSMARGLGGVQPKEETRDATRPGNPAICGLLYSFI